MSDPFAIIVAVHYRPEVSGGVPRILIAEDFLVRAGFRVAILTPQPIARGCRGAEILHVPAPAYLGVGAAGRVEAASPWQKLRRSLRHAVKRVAFIPDTFVYWSLRAARRAVAVSCDAPPDLVLSSSPQESSHWVGWQLQRRFGCRWIADFRDGWTFEPHRPEALLPLRRTIERRLERLVLERADWITAATRPIAEDFQRRFPDRRDRVHFLPSGFEELPLAPAGRDDGLFRLVYTGRFGLSHQARTLEAFLAGVQQALAASEPFRRCFRLVVVGDLLPDEQRRLQTPPLGDHVEVLGRQPYETAMNLAAGATMLLLVTPPGLRSIATRKLFDYLAVRRPVFALAEDNEAARILAETRAGVCIAPDRPAAVAEGLLRAFSWWQAGRLDEHVPCSGNDLYQAGPHFTRVLGETILPEVLRARSARRTAAEGRS